MGCQGQCNQGRKKCPIPQACELPEEADKSSIIPVVVGLIAAMAFVLAIVL